MLAGRRTDRHEPERVTVRSVRGNAFLMLVGTVTFAAAQWLAIVVIARVGSPKLVGQYALGLAIAGPVVLLASLNLRAALTTDALEKYPVGLYVRVRLIGIVISFITIVLISFGLAFPIPVRTVIVMVGALKSVEAYSDIIYGAAQRIERHDLVARSLVARGLLGVAALTVGMIVSGGSLAAGLSFTLAVWMLVVFLNDIPSAVRLGVSRHELVGVARAGRLGGTLRLAREAAPLGLVMLLGSLAANAPRYVVELFLGTEALGYFAAVASLLLIGSTIMNAVGQAASPRLALLAARNRTLELQRLVVRLLGIAVLVGFLFLILLSAFGSPILERLFTTAYGRYADVATVLMLAGVAMLASSVFGYSITALRAFRVQVPIEAAKLSVAVVALLVLVPRWGLIGAAWALVFVSVVDLLVKGVVFSRLASRLPAGTSVRS